MKTQRIAIVPTSLMSFPPTPAERRLLISFKAPASAKSKGLLLDGSIYLSKIKELSPA